MRKELLLCVVLGLLLLGSIGLIQPKNEWVSYQFRTPVCIAEGAPHYFGYIPIVQRTDDINNMQIWIQR